MLHQGKKRPRHADEQSWIRDTTGEFQDDQQNGVPGLKRSRIESNNRVPLELKEYIRGVAMVIADGPDQNEMELLGSRCLEECKNFEIPICCDPDASRDMEMICRASISNCSRFLSQLLMNKRKEITSVMTKAVGSRCLETISYELRTYLLTTSSMDMENIICDLFVKFGELLVDDFDRLVSTMCSTYILRAFGRICCGLGKLERYQNGDTKKVAKEDEEKVQDLRRRLLSRADLKSSVVAIAGRVLDWKFMCQYYHQESISFLVQEYIQLEAYVANEDDRPNLHNLITNALQEEYKQTVLDHWMSKQASRVWESVLKNCQKDELIDQLYRSHLTGKIPTFAVHPFANFPLQRLLERCNGKELTADIVDELLPFFDELWSTKRCGVVAAIASACARNRARQKEFKKILLKTVGCHEKEKRKYLLPILLQLSTHNDADANECQQKFYSLTISPFGSALVQHLLHFRKPKLMVNCILELDDDDLKALAFHAAGCHIIDAFFDSQSITDIQKSELLKRLTAHALLVPLSCDKYGSRVMEILWTRSNDKERSAIAKILTNDKAMSTLSRSRYGRILWTKYHLEKYKASPKEWKKFMNSIESKMRMLNDLLE